MSIFEEDEATIKEKEKLPSCLEFFNKWRHCSSSRHQFYQYYIYGKFADCKEEQANWTNCLSSKLRRNTEARASIIASLQRAKAEQDKIHTSGIWEFRKNPGEDWKGL